MEQNLSAETLWRVWIDTTNRIVSFHEAEGCQLVEFQNRELYVSYITGFVGKNYRYQ